MSNELTVNDILKSLCFYDPMNPEYFSDYFEDDYKPEPRRIGCMCDNCFHGTDRLAVALLEMKGLK